MSCILFHWCFVLFTETMFPPKRKVFPRYFSFREHLQWICSPDFWSPLLCCKAADIATWSITVFWSILCGDFGGFFIKDHVACCQLHGFLISLPVVSFSFFIYLTRTPVLCWMKVVGLRILASWAESTRRSRHCLDKNRTSQTPAWLEDRFIKFHLKLISTWYCLAARKGRVSCL